jgi:hypothetical protein
VLAVLPEKFHPLNARAIMKPQAGSKRDSHSGSFWKLPSGLQELRIPRLTIPQLKSWLLPPLSRSDLNPRGEKRSQGT